MLTTAELAFLFVGCYSSLVCWLVYGYTVIR